MALDFGLPVALWLLVTLPLVWLAGRAGVGRVRRVHIVLRALVIASVVTALAEPVVSWSASRVAMVYLVDVSHSVSTQAIDSAAAAIDAMTGALQPDESHIIAFGRTTARLDGTDQLRRIAADATRSVTETLIAPDGTNIEQALAAARVEIPSSANGRVVVFSDGRETEGRSRRIAQHLAAERVPVFTQPLAVRDLGDTWVGDFRLPGVAVQDGVTTTEVVLESQSGGEATIVITEGGRALASRRLPLVPGSVVVPMDVVFASAGAHLIEVSVTMPGDVLVANNTLRREVVVEPRSRVLFVTESLETIAGAAALTRAGLAVTTMRPRDLPTSPAAFDRWDVVVLSNLPRPSLPTRTMTALATWVEERGGGLLFAGGGVVVGEQSDNPSAGYRRTPVERVLPVTFDREDEPEIALVVVLDRSWSMNGPAMELSKAAAEAAAMTLEPDQIVGVLTFNNTFEWDVPLARMRDTRAGLHDAIARITPGGPTSIYPALKEAYEALLAVRARARHVILLSDGQTLPEDFQGLVTSMAKARMTVSSVSLGPEADVRLLSSIAAWGGGRSYPVLDAREIPAIFVKEARSAATPGFDGSGTIATVVRQSAVLSGLSRVPGVLGRNAVTRKPEAIDILSTAGGEPLLTMWPAGLGRTAMLAVDLEGRWTPGWVGWRGFDTFLSSTVRSLAQRRPGTSSLVVTTGDGSLNARELTLTLDARDGDGRRANLLSPRVTVTSEANLHETVSLAQVSPGRYEARVVADTSTPLSFAVEGSAENRPSRILVTDPAAEFRLGAPDDGLLDDLARITGGTSRPTAGDVRRAPRSDGVTRHALAPWLLLFGLVCWIGDIAARRLWR